MITYFMSGKIYQDSPGGKIISGYFSTTADSDIGESDTFEEMFSSIAKNFNAEEKSIHVEQFYKI